MDGSGYRKNSGDTYYVDFERIKKNDGYLYWWNLRDFLKPTEYDDLSYKTYIQGDCHMFRFEILAESLHIQPMGKGTPSASSNKPEQEWHYPYPNSAMEIILKSVCAHANKR